ncbi:hypothetical protein GCM10020218_097050 [Dactylosporangium vinaceum]|uniref:Uncharacterized protein n=1 Tax=Dactylosporangium vinaceum TaxID=53362 RepID=A0ABV5M2S9_9ACTN
MRIVEFRAGGRAGRRAVAFAAERGHEATAVVRDRSRDLAFSYGDLAAALVDEAETPRHHREPVAVAR